MTWLRGLCLKAYGEFTDLQLDFGEHLTVVYGTNEAGKSTALDALTDFLWGIPARSNRASSFARTKLVLDGDVNVDGETIRCIRRATGLADQRGMLLGPGPWNPDGSLDREWWHARFGIDHRALRAGGAAVLAATQGARDLSDLIFVARRGEVAHTVHEALTSQLGKVYVTDGRRRTALRSAWDELEESRRKLQAKMMRAGDVDQQRSVYESAERDLRAASDQLTEAQRSLNTAAAHARVIDHVLAYLAAEAELDELDAAGSRLDPDELEQYLSAETNRAEADAEAEAARGAAAERQHRISELAVDHTLLAAGEDIDALARALQARLEDNDELLGKHRPAVEGYEAALRESLNDLGVDVSEGVGTALIRSRVRVDLAETLDDLAVRVESVAQERTTHRRSRQDALGRLADRGILLDLGVSQPLAKDEVRRAKRDLRATEQAVEDGQHALDRLTNEIVEVLNAQDLPLLEASLSQEAVIEARNQRDVAWEGIRQDWVVGTDSSVETRYRFATRFEGLVSNADQTADRESAEREARSARLAVADIHDGRLRELERQVDQQRQDLEVATARLESAQSDWTDLWLRGGIATAPPLDDADLSLADLNLTHKESSDLLDAEERLVEVMTSWVAVAADAGLPESATPTTWRARSSALQAIDRIRAELEKTRAVVARIEQKWETYSARALALLGALEPSASAPSGPLELATRVRELRNRLTEQRAHQAISETMQAQVEDRQAEQRRSIQRSLDAQWQIDALRDALQVDHAELARRAARAERATAPLQRMAAAVDYIRTAWPESHPQDVIRSLRREDKATIEAECHLAQDVFDDAQKLEGALREERANQRMLLQQAEGKEGADQALGQVREAEASVTGLASRWLQLRFQVELLQRVIAAQGTTGALPLLADAGEILEHFTDGRWVALQPTPGHGARALRILRADGLEAGPAELSEGTLDQVYLALRLAAVRELHRQRGAEGKPTMPLVLDDVLMAFDVPRTKEALTLLSELASSLQIIVFTHHSYVAEQARQLPNVHVTELPLPSRIASLTKAEELRSSGPPA